jgi:hypothetical protein
MKLSDAIRQGAKLLPQHFGGYFLRAGEEGEYIAACCALGGVALALGINPNEVASCRDHIEAEFPEIFSLVPSSTDSDTLWGVIVHWNDKDRLSREEIADRVAALGY